MASLVSHERIAAGCCSHASLLRNRAHPLQAASALHGSRNRLRKSTVVICEAERPDASGSSDQQPSDSTPDSASVSANRDWRAFRARLVALEADAAEEDTMRQPAGMWAHNLPNPEPGCLLLAHPLCFAGSQQYFRQACILIFAHDERGTAGLILNRRTERTLGTVQGAEMLCPAFANSALYLGGDVGGETMHLLHPYDLEGAQEVVRGMYLGGFNAAKAGIEAGELEESKFKFLTRYSGWGPGQLQRECAAGVWFTAAASPAFMLQHDLDGDDMWHQALELMGGDYFGLSKATKGDDQQIFPPEQPGAEGQ